MHGEHFITQCDAIYLTNTDYIPEEKNKHDGSRGLINLHWRKYVLALLVKVVL